MKKLSILIVFLVLISALDNGGKRHFYSAERDVYSTGAVFFTDSINSDELKVRYDNSYKKIKILIAPGHEVNEGGTKFNGIKESYLVALIGEELAQFLKRDPRFDVVLVRDRVAYNPIFPEYFSRERESIKTFLARQKKEMGELVEKGDVHIVNGVFHNNAAADFALKLYGINKWSNENEVDIVLNLHINDYPRRNMATEGGYSGFAIYVPEKQFSNARASGEAARYVFDRLIKLYEKSDLPIENAGIVSDQELIALGAFNTLDAIGLLIEYGYIYEPQFQNSEVRESVVRELAFQTYLGIEDFLVGRPVTPLFNTALLPHIWKKTLKRGEINEDALALQVALIKENLYPPVGKTKKECPVSGMYGNCTSVAVRNFQQKYGVGTERGFLDFETRMKLNELYGR